MQTTTQWFSCQDKVTESSEMAYKMTRAFPVLPCPSHPPLPPRPGEVHWKPWELIKPIERSDCLCEVPGIDFVQNTIGGGSLFPALFQSLGWKIVWEEEKPGEYSRGRKGGRRGSRFFDYNSLLHYKKAARTVVFKFTVKRKNPHAHRREGATGHSLPPGLIYFTLFLQRNAWLKISHEVGPKCLPKPHFHVCGNKATKGQRERGAVWLRKDHLRVSLWQPHSGEQAEHECQHKC